MKWLDSTSRAAAGRHFGNPLSAVVVVSRYCVIFNPTAGRRRNDDRLKRLCALLGESIEMRPTAGIGDATRLAATASDERFDTVIAAGGDGTVHEVACGLLQAAAANTERPPPTLGIFPVGSANDYAHSLEREFGEAVRGPSGRVVVDVGRVTGLSDEPAYFVNSVGLGFAGAVTIESRRIRWLRGVPLYGLAALRALFRHWQITSWRITMDDEPHREWPTLLLSALLGRREGNFILAPDAKLADGWFNFAHAGTLTRWEICRLLPSLAMVGPPPDYPNVKTGLCRRLAVKAPIALAAHVDGEILCRPEEGRTQCQIEILPGRLQVQVLPVL